MKQIRTFTSRQVSFWTSAKGDEYDITEMSDDYVWNCINMLGTKISILALTKNSRSIIAKIAELKDDKNILVKEMDRRHSHKIYIDRIEGCERR